jgi:hypothetical protein
MERGRLLLMSSFQFDYLITSLVTHGLHGEIFKNLSYLA